MNEWWRVEVRTHDGELVAIEPEMLAGKSDLTDSDLETIRECGRHLLAFAGDGDAVPYFELRCNECGEEYPGAELFTHACNATPNAVLGGAPGTHRMRQAVAGIRRSR